MNKKLYVLVTPDGYWKKFLSDEEVTNLPASKLDGIDLETEDGITQVATLTGEAAGELERNIPSEWKTCDPTAHDGRYTDKIRARRALAEGLKLLPGWAQELFSVSLEGWKYKRNRDY